MNHSCVTWQLAIRETGGRIRDGKCKHVRLVCWYTCIFDRGAVTFSFAKPGCHQCRLLLVRCVQV